MALSKINIILNNVLPKIKMNLSPIESFNKQWEKYLNNPALETPLTAQLNMEITQMIFDSIIREKYKLHQLMLLLQELKLEGVPLPTPKDEEYVDSFSRKKDPETAIYYSYSTLLILILLDTLIKELDTEIAMLNTLERNLTNQMTVLNLQINDQLNLMLEHFVTAPYEGILIGQHPDFLSLLQNHCSNPAEHAWFHGKLGEFIHQWYKHEHGMEPGMTIINSIRHRIHQRFEPTLRLADQRQMVNQERVTVVECNEACQRIRREAVQCRDSLQTGAPGHENEYRDKAHSLMQRYYQRPVPRPSGSPKRDQDNEYKYR